MTRVYAAAVAFSLALSANVGATPIAVLSSTADAAGQFYDVSVGDVLDLDASSSTTDPTHFLTSYRWDLNGDGIFAPTIIAPIGTVVVALGLMPVDVQTATPFLQYLNRNWVVGGTQFIGLQVTDETGAVASVRGQIRPLAPQDDLVPAPEPGSLILLGTGLVAALRRAMVRKRAGSIAEPR